MAVNARLRWITLGALLGLAFLWAALRGVDLGAVRVVLESVQVGATLATLAAALGFMLCKALRWSILLRPLARVQFGYLHSATYIGSAANLIVAHSGEIVRAMLVGRRAAVAPSAVLATIGIERLFDFVAMLVMLGLVLAIDRHLAGALTAAGLFALAAVVVGIAAMLALLRPTPATSALGQALLRLLPGAWRAWTLAQVRRSRAGLAPISDPATALLSFAVSIVQWGCIVAAVSSSVAAVGLAVTLSAAVGVFVLLMVGLTLPTAPAQLGTTQLAFAAGLALTGTGAEAAFAASVVYTCAVVVPVVILGALCWLWMMSANIDRGEHAK